MAVLAVFQLPPVALAVVLNFLRPDLMKPMLDHIFGYVLVMVISLLWLVQGVALGIAWGGGTGRSAKIGLTVGALVVCTLPMVLMILFGPIVFAFMFGNVD